MTQQTVHLLVGSGTVVCILAIALLQMYTLVYIKCYTKHRPSLFISHCDGDNVHNAIIMRGSAPSAVKISFGIKLNLITYTSVTCHYAAVLSQVGNSEKKSQNQCKVVQICTRE